MADFGFNSEMILNDLQANARNQNDTQRLINEQNRTKIDQQRENSEDQIRQASLRDMLYKQGRERSLADVYRQGAGAFTTPGAQALAGGGFGPEAEQFEAKSLSAQEAAIGLAKLHKELLVSKAGTVQTPDQAPGFLASIPQSQRDAHGLPDPTDPDAFKKIQQFRASAITPEQQETNQLKRDEMNKSRFKPDAFGRVVDTWTGQVAGNAIGSVGVNPVTGGYYNKRGGAPAGGQPTTSTGAPNPLLGMKPKDINEQFNKLANDLSDNNTRKLLGQNAQSIQKAEGLEALLKVPDLNKINPQQLREAGTSLAGLISKGGPQAVSQIEELVPQSKAAEWANFKQKWLNEPEGANASAFLQNMLDTAAREKKTTLMQQDRLRQEVIPNYAYLRKANPARYESILKGVRLNPDDFDENGLKKVSGSAPAAHPQDGVAVQWAKDNLNDPKLGAKARDILKANGVQ